jgi:hypothetical protein
MEISQVERTLQQRDMSFHNAIDWSQSFSDFEEQEDMLMASITAGDKVLWLKEVVISCSYLQVKAVAADCSAGSHFAMSYLWHSFQPFAHNYFCVAVRTTVSKYGRLFCNDIPLLLGGLAPWFTYPILK